MFTRRRGGADSPSGGFEAAETDSLSGGGFTEADPDALETDETETSKGFSDVTEEMPELLTENGVTYLDADGEQQTQDNVTVINDRMVNLTEGWYVVNGSLGARLGTVTVEGNVHLILADECHYDTSDSGGIVVNEGNSLTIYAQSTGEQMGQLTAESGVDAGIGANGSGSAGTITINGGRINATGGGAGAGIGGKTGGVGTITINGGEVTATGESGAGIGNGAYGTLGGSITINGGKVTATGGFNAAGIGGGANSYNTDGTTLEITINGGEVTATTPNAESCGAGIGGGRNTTYSTNNSCDINITITGGTVKAVGGSDGGAGIGGAYNTPGTATVTISGGMVTATGGAPYGDGIGDGYPTSSTITGPKYTFKVTFSTTGENDKPGNAVIVATGGGDDPSDDTKGIDAVNEGDRSSWSGIIFEKDISNGSGASEKIPGSVYGSPNFTKDFTIPENCVLTIASDKTLTVPDKVTMTNNGTITVEGGTLTNNGAIVNNETITVTSGTMTNSGHIDNYGTITNVTGDVRDPSDVSVAITGDSVKDESGTYSAPYAETVTITATISEKPETEENINLLTAGKANVDEVVFTATDGTTSWELGKVTELTETDDGYTASIKNVKLGNLPNEGNTSDTTTKNWEADATYTITADFGGKAGDTESTEQGLIAGKGTATLTVKKRDRDADVTPASPVAVKTTATSIELEPGVPSDEHPMEYGYAESEGGAIKWQSEKTIENLKSAMCYYVYARYAEDKIYNASNPSDRTHCWTKHADPDPGEGYTIDYKTETVTAQSDFQVSLMEYENWNAGPIKITPGSTFWVRHAGVMDSTGPEPSDSTPVTLDPRPDAPSGLSPVRETLSGCNDGKITGTDTTMEYKLTTASEWTDCTGTQITRLAPGTYQVRLAATEDAFAGESAQVTIDAGEERTYTLSVTAPTFDSVYTGYTQPEAKAITITSSGNSDAAISEVTVSGTDFTIGGRGDTVPAEGSIATWTVQPAAGLAAGTHTATITVTYNGGATATAEVKFIVDQLPAPAPTYSDRTLVSGGISLSGSGIHRDARLTVTEGKLHESGESCAVCGRLAQWQELGRILAIYDVSLSRDFQGTVTLAFPAPEGYEGKTLTILHCLYGEPESRDVKVTGGEVQITVDSLSPFAILERRDLAECDVEVNGDTVTVTDQGTEVPSDEYTVTRTADTLTVTASEDSAFYTGSRTLSLLPESTALTVTGRTTSAVSLSWDEVEEAEGYTIWFRSEYDDTLSRHIIWNGDTTSWTHKGLQPGTKYFYKIRAWVTDEDGKYIFSDIEEARTQRGTTKPEAARIIGVTVTGGKIKVRLEGEAAGAERYSMCYGESRGCFRENDFQVGIRTSYTVRTLTPEFAKGTYYVCVKSYRDLGNNKRVYGEWSNTFRAVVK